MGIEFACLPGSWSVSWRQILLWWQKLLLFTPSQGNVLWCFCRRNYQLFYVGLQPLHSYQWIIFKTLKQSLAIQHQVFGSVDCCQELLKARCQVVFKFAVNGMWSTADPTQLYQCTPAGAFNPYHSILHPPSVFGCDIKYPFVDFMNLNLYICSTCWLIFGYFLNVFGLTNSEESWLLNEMLCKYLSAFLLHLLTFGKEECRKCLS